MTSSKIVPFKFDSHEVRTIIIDGEPWFVGKDIAEILGYASPKDAIRAHCKGAAIHPLPTNGGIQSYSIIPERDVYRLIMRSKLPEAERFEEWVVGEVLPTIRKTGGYQVAQALPNFSDPVAAARAWADEVEAKPCPSPIWGEGAQVAHLPQARSPHTGPFFIWEIASS